MTYEETLEYLFNAMPMFQQVGGSAYKPGLDRTLAFDALLGHPHRRFRTIHVAGTNGKGSVSHILASILQRHGLRVGLYTSPHLRDFRERIRIDGQTISEEAVTGFVARHRAQMEALQLSFFEMTVGLAFDHFAREEVDIAVIETGLGGRLDSTNIITPLASVITNIGFDHMQYLGDTLPLIAAEKAGIIKPGVPAIVGETDPLTAPVFTARAAEAGTTLVFADRLFRCAPAVGEAANGARAYTDAPQATDMPHAADAMPVRYDGIEKPSVAGADAAQPTVAGTGKAGAPSSTQTLAVTPLDGRKPFTVELDLLGDYQQRNLCTVLATIDTLNDTHGLGITPTELCEGCAAAARCTGLLGRWQVLGHDPLTVCDTGHNEHGLRWIAAQLARQRYEHLYIVLGMVGDKDLDRALPLLPRHARYIFTQASIRRALPAGELAAAAARYGLCGEAVPGVRAAYARAREQATPRDMIFVGGSTFTVADLLA
ncbi:MAG: bifunctional folylpolyglutamate synthase/dihydrofolate synthase [Rikenellaceae bacterium]|nr:bifunctional folylpolyglutamate synthase/dihydrofolate synthase [Rikenellaceae bacterium]